MKNDDCGATSSQPAHVMRVPVGVNSEKKEEK